jgi:hypothetical protein
MKVLVIPEDFRKDQYILKPIVEAMMKKLGKPRAKVEVCPDPLLGGVDRALRWQFILPIIESYKYYIDLFLHIVDRDGKAGRRTALDNIELKAKDILDAGTVFFSENAWQEIEVWVLAGHKLPKPWKWSSIRAEANSKEVYYEPFAKERGLINEPGEGRKTLALEAASRYARIRQLCPEDIAALEEKIKKSFQ